MTPLEKGCFLIGLAVGTISGIINKNFAAGVGLGTLMLAVYWFVLPRPE